MLVVGAVKGYGTSRQLKMYRLYILLLIIAGPRRVVGSGFIERSVVQGVNALSCGAPVSSGHCGRLGMIGGVSMVIVAAVVRIEVVDRAKVRNAWHRTKLISRTVSDL